MSHLIINNLRTEYAENPLGIDSLHPYFSWQMSHPQRGMCASAYQILVASSLEGLQQNRGDLWDSGKSAFSDFPVAYAGVPLHSRQRCWWKVRAWDQEEMPGVFSDFAWFEMGLLKPDDWQAEWIGFPAGWNGKALYFRCPFQVEKPIQQARVYLCGLGYYELRLNGQKAGENVLDPAPTAYDHRALYRVFDVSAYLHSGENVAGVIVGNGWYGSPRLIFQMEIQYQDGSEARVLSGRSGKGIVPWQVSDGAIQENSIYQGEVYDARLEIPGWDAPGTPLDTLRRGNWAGVSVVERPGGNLQSHAVEPMRVVETIRPVSIIEPKPGVRVYDMGANMAGWVRLHVQGERGATVTMRFAESLYPDGTVNQENLRSAKARDIYILNGNGKEVWEPRFTYHGFRFIQLEGYPGEPDLASIEGRVVRSAVPDAGEFECSCDLLNRIHTLVRRTEASNLHGIPTDCPQRDERMGWLNDMAARVEEALYNFDMSRFLAKWTQDIEDTQDKEGAITDTAPFRWGRRPADPVSVIYLLLPWLLYRHYGNRRILEERYAGMKAWVDYLSSRSEDFILPYSYYGDWSPPIAEGLPGSLGSSAVSRDTPGALISTGFYHYSAFLLGKIAQILGKKADAVAYTALANQIARAYNQRFWNEEAGGYGSNNQACNAFSIYLGLAQGERRERAAQNLVRDVIELHDGHLTTGNICTRYLLEALSELGRSDVAFTIASQESYPGWGFMLANGATTLWERWEHLTGGGMNSHNHPMMGSVDSWFYKYLGGIQLDPEDTGFARIRIHPHPVEGVDWAKVSLLTIRGFVRVVWKKERHGFYLEAEVPVGSTARVWMPKPRGQAAYSLFENGKPVLQVEGITGVTEQGDSVVVSIGSGIYRFSIQ